MRTVVAIVLGLLSGFLIYMTGTMLFVDGRRPRKA
jgi:hypothetical protein